MSHNVIIVGNANVGKTTLYNQLTHSKEHVGNWSGVTSSSVSSHWVENQNIKIFDTPGLFNLHEPCQSIGSLYRWILKNNASKIIQVISVRHLKRDLCLTQQLTSLRIPVCLVFNDLDAKVPIDAIKKHVGEFFSMPCIDFENNRLINQFIGQRDIDLSQQYQADGSLDLEAEQQLDSNHDNNLLAILEKRYTVAHELASKVSIAYAKPALSKFFDRPVILAASFVLIIFAIFSLSVGIGGVLSAVLHEFFSMILIAPAHILSDKFLSLCLVGFGVGVQLLGDFFFPLLLLYFFLRWMEESGFSARSALMMDKFFRRLGLSGKTFLPLLMGLGCNVPAIAATRMLPEGERIKAAMMLPFMTCSARLTTYLAMSAVYFPRSGPWVIFSLYLMGFLTAFLTAFIAKKQRVLGAQPPLVMAIPRLKFKPKLRYLNDALSQALSFVKEAAIIVIPGSIILHLLLALVQDQSELFKSFILSFFTMFDYSSNQFPAAFGIIAGLLAKEMVITTMIASNSSMVIAKLPLGLYDFGVRLYDVFASALGDYLTILLQPSQALGVHAINEALVGVFANSAQAMSFLVFIALYFPCISTIGVLKRVIGVKKTSLIVLWSIFIAYIGAWLVYRSLLLDLVSLFYFMIVASLIPLGIFIKNRMVNIKTLLWGEYS